MSANLEYAAHNHGHGSGWSWEQAKGRGKMHDMIEAQRQAWDQEVLHLEASCPPDPEQSVNVFNTRVRARRRASMCRWQIIFQMEREQDMFRFPLPGTAGQVEAQLRDMLYLTLTRSRKGLRVFWVVTPREFVDQAQRLALGHGGAIQDIDVDKDGDVERIVIRFPDQSEIRIDDQGVR